MARLPGLVAVPSLILGLTTGAAAAAADPNEAAQGVTPSAVAELDTPSLSAVFPGPLDSFAINLTIVNNSGEEIETVELNGLENNLVWDSFPVGDALSISGEDTRVVTITFAGFTSGTSASFVGIDPDFVGDPSSGVHVREMASTMITARTTKGRVTLTGFFVANDTDVIAVIE